MQQQILNTLLRVAGHMVPTAGGLDFRLIRRLHGMIPPTRTSPWIAGNGFLLGADTSNVTFIAGASEKTFLRMVTKQVDRVGLVVNIGANIGYTILFLAKALFEKGTPCNFLALEPEPQTYAMLVRNIALNPFKIKAECVAAGDRERRAKFYSTGVGDGAASLDRREDPRAVESEVLVRRLDDILDARVERGVVGLVIDVEGHAGAVLRGSARTLRDYRPFVAAEIHNAQEQEELGACLQPLGYAISNRSQSIWGKHLIWRPVTAST